MFNEVSQFQSYIEAGALGVAQPDASVLAGPHSCLAVGRQAEQQGIRVAMHSFAGPVAQMQNVHAALAIPECDWVEFATLYHPIMQDVLEPIWKFKDGRFEAPSTPGMGICITPTLQKRYAYQNIVSLIATSPGGSTDTNRIQLTKRLVRFTLPKEDRPHESLP